MFSGVLRASHTCTYNAALSTQPEPFYDHDKREALQSGKIYPLEIGLWPWGVVFDEGEGIAVLIGGHDMCNPELELTRPAAPELVNTGRHTVHSGGEYDSHLLLPLME